MASSELTSGFGLISSVRPDLEPERSVFVEGATDQSASIEVKKSLGKQRALTHVHRKRWRKCRTKAHAFMNPEPKHMQKYGPKFLRAARAFQGLVVFLVFLNLALAAADIDDASTLPLWYVSVFTCLVFTFELAVRFWTCVEASEQGHCTTRLKFIVKPLNVLDFVTVVLIWLCLFGHVLLLQGSTSTALRVVRLARMSRLSRIARLVATGRFSALLSRNSDDLEARIPSLQSAASDGTSLWRSGSGIDEDDADALSALEHAIDTRDAAALKKSERQCECLQIPEHFTDGIKMDKKVESEQAGVSLAYLLSREFTELAIRSTDNDDPTFIEMQDPFFLHGPNRIGESLLCPRDLKLGCAFIDALPQKHRKKANCFLSWVWGYKLSVLQNGLARWAHLHNKKPEDTYLYMCFFCNNQWRILVEQSTEGTDNLEEVFEKRLKQVGTVIALMDTWDNPLYTTRIWTIYEQYKAACMGMKVHFALPTEHRATLLQQLSKGKEGIMCVVQAVSKVDALRAQATRKQDEEKVKALIRNSIGFQKVNASVRVRITGWVAAEFKSLIDELISEVDEEARSCVSRDTWSSLGISGDIFHSFITAACEDE